MKQKQIKFDKPIYLGMSILDISKNKMYEFHYDYMKPKYGEKLELLYTDTDSLIYEIQTEDFYKDISGDIKEFFDTSDFIDDHPSGIKTDINKKKIGMFKDECNGKQMTECIGLRSKSYSFKVRECEGEGKELKKILQFSKLKKDKYKGKLRKPNRLKKLEKEFKINEKGRKKM